MSGGSTPAQAAAAIVKVINSKNPNFFNEIALRDRAFMSLNRVLPYKLRDAILVRHMGIKV